MTRTIVKRFDFKTNTETILATWDSIGRTMHIENFYEDSMKISSIRSETKVFDETGKTIDKNVWNSGDDRIEYLDYAIWLQNIVDDFDKREKEAFYVL